MKESIKNLREKHNYSQSYLATYLEVSRQMYIKYESGEVEPPIHVVVKLAKLYKVSYDTIIDDKLSTSKNSVSYKISHPTENTEKEVASPASLYSANPYYLQLERKYRLFYNVKRENKLDDHPFDMNFNNIKIEMKDASRISFLKCMFSSTEVLFYMTCIATSIVVYLI